MSDRERREGAKIKGKNPDRGPPVMEGEQRFDKGYDSDDEHFCPPGAFPDNDMRGNPYMELQNEIVGRDSKKLNKSKFSKIA